MPVSIFLDVGLTQSRGFWNGYFLYACQNKSHNFEKTKINKTVHVHFFFILKNLKIFIVFIWSAMLLHYNNNVKYCFIKTVNSETAFVSLVLDFFVWWSILFMINDNTFSFGTMSWVCMYGSNLKFSQHTHCAGVDYLRPGIRTCPRSFSSERAASPWRLWGCTWGVRALVLQY